MDKHEIAHVLAEIALLLEIQGESPFKSRAYVEAAHAIEDLDEDLELIVAENRLKEVPGIGESIAHKVSLLVSEGNLPYYDDLKKAVPEGLLKIMAVPGVGPKKARILYDTLKLHTIEELEEACRKGQIAEIKGFGEKSQDNILSSLEKIKAYERRMLWWEAGKFAFPLIHKFTELKVVQQAIVAGSFRRKMETIGDLDFLVASEDPKAVIDWFTSQSPVESIQASGSTRASVRFVGGLQADLRVVTKEEFPYALLYFTGSKDFNIHLRKRANGFGYTLNEYGMTPLKGKGKKAVECHSEGDIFKALKLAYIPAELREGHAVIEAAEKDKIPELVEEKDIRGIFHCHTTESDGHNTLEEMVKAAEEHKWEYIGISDHSKSSVIAHGMDETRLLAQVEKIRKLNASKKYSLHVFAGVECDILNTGELDFSDEILKVLDFVIISAHGALLMDEDVMTARLIKAIENPYTTFVGHVTGRILLKREPYKVNLTKIIDACIANHKIIELNAHPNRLDMDWRLWHKASEKGLLCSINPDAHRIADLNYYVAGVNVARKGWLTKSHILNTHTLKQVQNYLVKKKLD